MEIHAKLRKTFSKRRFKKFAPSSSVSDNQKEKDKTVAVGFIKSI